MSQKSINKTVSLLLITSVYESSRKGWIMAPTEWWVTSPKRGAEVLSGTLGNRFPLGKEGALEEGKTEVI